MDVFRTLVLAVVLLGGFSFNEVHGLTIFQLSDRLRKLSTDESGLAIQSRQLRCTFPSDYPQSCFDSLDLLTVTSSGIGTFASVGFTLTLRTALDGACKSECLAPALQFYRCLDEENLAEAYESGLCGQQAGQYCLELYRRGIGDSIIPNFQTSCTRYNASLNYLGCCAASLFGNPDISDSFFPFNSVDFINCYEDVDAALGSRCLPPTPDALQASVTESTEATSGELATQANAK